MTRKEFIKTTIAGMIAMFIPPIAAVLSEPEDQIPETAGDRDYIHVIHCTGTWTCYFSYGQIEFPGIAGTTTPDRLKFRRDKYLKRNRWSKINRDNKSQYVRQNLMHHRRV